MAKIDRIRDAKTGEYQPENRPIMVTVSAKFTEEEREELKELAEKLGYSLSELVRAVMRAWMDTKQTR